MAGARPMLGRLFTPDEDQLGCTPVILLSEGTWRNRFAADPRIINRVVMVDGVAATIVGVMPASFRFPNDQEMWQPLGYSPFERNARSPVIDVIGRLKPGITPARAAADLQQITARRGGDTMAARFDLHPVVTPFREYYLAPELHRSALVLFGLSLVFVIVSCANAANLVMIDFFGRSAEIATTLALGVPRAATIRGLGLQLFISSLLAAAIGTGVLLLAAPHLHQALALANAPYWLGFAWQWHHGLAAVVLAVVCAGVALLVPLGFLLLANPEQIIRNSAGANRGSGRGWWRHLLMIAQVALLTVLAVSAGLLLRSSRHVGEQHWGFDAHNIFNGKTAMKEAEFPTSPGRFAVQMRMLAEMERLPGVTAAAVMSGPIGYSGPPAGFYARTIDGLADGRSEGGAQWSLASPHIFAALGVNFIEGESFTGEEKPDGPAYVVVNHSLAQRLWPGQSAVGRSFYVRLHWNSPKDPPQLVVIKGVVQDFQAAGPLTSENDAIYGSLSTYCPAYLFLYVRGLTAPPTLSEITQAAHRVDSRLPVYLPSTLQGVIDGQLGSVHLTSRLTTVFAIAAILLCAVGIYSITVSQILQRNREFGIRMALGIAPQRLWVRFARHHLLVAAVGIGLGLAAAAAVSTILRSLLFGVQPHDVMTFTAVAAMILIVSALACIPSLFRLRRINPADCLRSL
jgi:putative ABC transport system permease protein